MDNHFREDSSCYHVVDYDKKQGGVRGKYTAQGYAQGDAYKLRCCFKVVSVVL